MTKRFRAVAAAIIERHGRVLICQRKKGARHELKWEFPGGKVEPGETPSQALKRELAEELAIDAVIGPELTRYRYRYPGRPPVLLVFFRVVRYSGDPRNLQFEEIRWELRARLPSYDFLEGDTAFVKRLARGEP
jgi:8-oxo-dGTP diphosphatase